SLVGLSEAAVASYVELAASEIASAELTAALFAQTEGNPLFVSETVRLLALEHPGSLPDGLVAIPQTVREVIARRLSHLAAAGHRLLMLASILGREFPLDAVARLADMSEDESLEVIDEALAARVLIGVPGMSGRIRFAHVLIRDAVYDGITS